MIDIFCTHCLYLYSNQEKALPFPWVWDTGVLDMATPKSCCSYRSPLTPHKRLLFFWPEWVSGTWLGGRQSRRASNQEKPTWWEKNPLRISKWKKNHEAKEGKSCGQVRHLIIVSQCLLKSMASELNLQKGHFIEAVLQYSYAEGRCLSWTYNFWAKFS